jgi:hypothetical protein
MRGANVTPENDMLMDGNALQEKEFACSPRASLIGSDDDGDGQMILTSVVMSLAIESRAFSLKFAGRAKRPPGNRVASSLGRIVPTEAKPSELSGEILSLAK